MVEEERDVEFVVGADTADVLLLTVLYSPELLTLLVVFEFENTLLDLLEVL